MLRVLADHAVEWVLTGSTVLAIYGADITPNDLDVTPCSGQRQSAQARGGPRGTGSGPGLHAGLAGRFTIKSCRSWRPEPATEQQMEYLFVTRLGMLDVPLRMCGSYEQLLPAASRIEIGGTLVQVCNPREVLARAMALTSPKHRARAALYAAMRDGVGRTTEPCRGRPPRRVAALTPPPPFPDRIHGGDRSTPEPGLD